MAKVAEDVKKLHEQNCVCIVSVNSQWTDGEHSSSCRHALLMMMMMMVTVGVCLQFSASHVQDLYMYGLS